MRRKEARRAIRRVEERRDATVRVAERDTVVSAIASDDGRGVARLFTSAVISVTFRRDTMVDVADPDVPSGVAAGEGGATPPEVPGVPSGVLTRSQQECTDAAAAGDLTRLKYAHENGCPWNVWACAEAAEEGHLECLKYLHENGCPRIGGWESACEARCEPALSFSDDDLD